jgi:hypothetical protein
MGGAPSLFPGTHVDVYAYVTDPGASAALRRTHVACARAAGGWTLSAAGVGLCEPWLGAGDAAPDAAIRAIWDRVRATVAARGPGGPNAWAAALPVPGRGPHRCGADAFDAASGAACLALVAVRQCGPDGDAACERQAPPMRLERLLQRDPFWAALRDGTDGPGGDAPVAFESHFAVSALGSNHQGLRVGRLRDGPPGTPSLVVEKVVGGDAALAVRDANLRALRDATAADGHVVRVLDFWPPPV